jgi:hypothetical protein
VAVIKLNGDEGSSSIVSCRCIWLRDVSDTESVCIKGFPPAERCWTGEDNPCWAFMRPLKVKSESGVL